MRMTMKESIIETRGKHTANGETHPWRESDATNQVGRTASQERQEEELPNPREKLSLDAQESLDIIGGTCDIHRRMYHRHETDRHDA